MSSAVQEQEFAGSNDLPIVVQMQPVVNFSEDEFFQFCQVNRELRIERNERGEVLIMSPAGGESSHQNIEISMQLALWAKRDGTGIAFDSSAGFRLPNQAVRSPDASWIRLSRWNTVSAEEREKFPPICPDFVVELRSKSDRLGTLKAKLREYIDNGAELGLLIDPLQRQVHIYRRDQEAVILDDPKAVSCEPLMPGFTLDLNAVW